jgi:hypothetical protein
MPTMKKIDRSKRTKAELIDELQALEAAVKNAPSTDPTAQALARERVTQTREAAKGLSVDTIVTKGASFGLEVQRTVSGLTEQALQKAEELRTLQEAVDVEKEELERLYQLDVVSASTKALVEEIDAARKAWEEEYTAHNKAVAQRNAELTVQRTREQQEYDYRTQQERKKAKDDFQYEMQIARREQAESTDRIAKDFEARRAEIERQEKELAAGRARIENLDAEIKTKTDAEVAKATNAVKAAITQQFALERKDLENVVRLSEQRVADVVAQNARLTAEIVTLNKALEAARIEVKEIALKSVEGASGQTALQKVMEVQQRDNGQTTRGKA